MRLKTAGAAEQIRRYGYLLAYTVRSWLGRRAPLMGGVKLTHRCNLACVHCPFRVREAPSLSFAQAVAAMRTLHDWGVRILIFEGGEPLLWRDGAYSLDDVVAEAKKRFYSVAVTTNGTFPIETAADLVWVSIDGLRETHDRIRGKSYDRIVAHLDACTHPRVYAHVTVNTLNWQEVPALVRHLAPRVKGVTVQFHYPYDELASELFLPFETRRRVLDELIAMKRAGLPVANSYACLRALKDNRWTCRPWMIASVDPTGECTHGCYVKGRGDISCAQCGFSAHTELSLAYNGVIESILVGHRFFLARTSTRHPPDPQLRDRRL
jgi:MoaA/NifB/PqqE/SkfB family radical SAM enzyme